ncbi:MAG: hypothetical protein IJS65_06825 [Clostridia bacterium]|nr:hypothetical protein [Clostridia bacterium]
MEPIPIFILIPVIVILCAALIIGFRKVLFPRRNKKNNVIPDPKLLAEKQKKEYLDTAAHILKYCMRIVTDAESKDLLPTLSRLEVTFSDKSLESGCNFSLYVNKNFVRKDLSGYSRSLLETVFTPVFDHEGSLERYSKNVYLPETYTGSVHGANHEFKVLLSEYKRADGSPSFEIVDNVAVCAFNK